MTKRRPPTRAQALLGRSPAALMARTHRDIARVAKLIEGLAYAWSEIDGGMECDFNVLGQRLADIRDESLPAALEDLNRPWGEDA